MTRTSRHDTNRSRGRHRLAVLTWLGVYPLLTMIAIAVEPVLAGAPVPLRTLVISLIMVPAMVYAVMPAVMRLASKARADSA